MKILAGTGWGFAFSLLCVCFYLYGELNYAQSQTRKSIALFDNAMVLVTNCQREYKDFLAYTRERAK